MEKKRGCACRGGLGMGRSMDNFWSAIIYLFIGTKKTCYETVVILVRQICAVLSGG